MSGLIGLTDVKSIFLLLKELLKDFDCSISFYHLDKSNVVADA